VDSFRLETIGELHAVSTSPFVPFVVARLQSTPDDTEAILTVELRDVRETAGEHTIRFHWDRESIPRLPLAIQDNPLTEWAALGVACVVLWHFAGIRLHAVAAEGDRVDYWCLDGTQEFVLEVSGTTTDNLEARHREKVRQLLDNPHGADGYVIVVGFATRRVLFSFHRFDGRTP
jgi:hypothetical protein